MYVLAFIGLPNLGEFHNRYQHFGPTDDLEVYLGPIGQDIFFQQEICWVGELVILDQFNFGDYKKA